jgi:hypothetical protein
MDASQLWHFHLEDYVLHMQLSTVSDKLSETLNICQVLISSLD